VSRWNAFSDAELRDLDHAIGVEDQEYGADNREFWQEIRDEILCREHPDPVDRLKVREWEAAIGEDQRRFPSALDALLRAAYEPVVRRYLSSSPFSRREA